MSAPEPIRPEVEVIAPPALFGAWPDAVRQRAQDLWSTVGGRNCSAVQQLLQAETPDVRVPAASTICRWADDEAWHIAADHDLESTRNRTVRELKAGWLMAQKLAQATVLSGMQGLLDDLPYGGSARLKSAELALRTLERAGMMALLPDPLPASEDEMATLSEKEKSRRLREQNAERKREKAGR